MHHRNIALRARHQCSPLFDTHSISNSAYVPFMWWKTFFRCNGFRTRI